MTKYRVALNKDRTMWFHAGVSAPAETYIDIEWAETVAQQLRNGCYPDAHVIDVQPEPGKVDAHLAANPEPEPEPKYRSPMRLQRDQLREELKRAWDAIPPGIASRSDSVSAAVGKLAYVYNDNQHVADNYRAALRALPEEFRGYYALPDSVAKLAKAYEAIQTDNAKLREKVEILEQGNQEWVEIFDQGNQEWSDQVESLQEENAKLKDRLDAQKKTIADARDALPERWNDIPLADAFRGEMKDLKAELADIGAIIADELDLPCENTSHLEILRRRLRALMSRNVLAEQLQAENAKLKAKVEFLGNQLQLSAEDMKAAMAKPEPVSDAEIRRVLEEMGGCLYSVSIAAWHRVFARVAADLVVARESLEQVTKVKDEMRDGRDSAVKVMRALTEELAQCRSRCSVTLDAVTKERDEARAELEECKLALPDELRGGSAPQGIAQLAAHNAELVASNQRLIDDVYRERDRAANVTRERDEAREKLEELERANYKAWAALPHDVKVRGGYLAGRIGDLVRDLENMIAYRDELRTDRAALRDKLSKKQAAIAKALEL